jgi:hypothetical protein
MAPECALFKWRQNARYLNGAKMRAIKPE